MRIGAFGRGAALGLLLAATPALAQVERLGVFGDWEAYKVENPKAPECFIHSLPLESKGQYTRRGEVLAQLSHRPDERVRSELSITAGYTFSPGSPVEVEIDGRKFELFAHEDRAYARDASTDRELARRNEARPQNGRARDLVSRDAHHRRVLPAGFFGSPFRDRPGLPRAVARIRSLSVDLCSPPSR